MLNNVTINKKQSTAPSQQLKTISSYNNDKEKGSDVQKLNNQNETKIGFAKS